LELSSFDDLSATMTMSPGRTERRGTAFVVALLFVVIIVAVSLGIGYVTQPSEWYEKLAKPAFNPPSWVFGPVWTVLYILIAVAGWRIAGLFVPYAAWVTFATVLNGSIAMLNS
jgi:tryptophan-rich sensory protein